MLKYISLIASVLLYTSCLNFTSMNNHKPPRAKKEPKELIVHNDKRIDNYFWMRLSDKQKESKEPDQQTQNVINYLNAENKYLKEKMSHTEELQDALFNEIKNRIKKDDSSVPVKVQNYSYYSRYEKDKEYPFYCRKKNNHPQEEIILDVPNMAKGYAYYALGGRSISPNENLLVFGVDTRYFNLLKI